ncbi:hypothetical protein [Streptomyces sp. NPDC059759]|uniref:hypothetical protein n=1 Tax=Streptomyces sp. NPDC059759 TaxID=3346936 RepID=UPI00364E3DBE
MPEKETATSVRTGETVTTEVPTADEAYAAALLREREGYLRRGREDRVADVDAELERLGYQWEEKIAEVDDDSNEREGDDPEKPGDKPPTPPEPEPEPEPQETATESKPRRTARGAGKS